MGAFTGLAGRIPATPGNPLQSIESQGACVVTFGTLGTLLTFPLPLLSTLSPCSSLPILRAPAPLQGSHQLHKPAPHCPDTRPSFPSPPPLLAARLPLYTDLQGSHQLHVEFMREFLADLGEGSATTTQAVLDAQDAAL